jgi:hypothetical protein
VSGLFILDHMMMMSRKRDRDHHHLFLDDTRYDQMDQRSFEEEEELKKSQNRFLDDSKERPKWSLDWRSDCDKEN